MMVGPILGSILYSIGGFQLPFYVTGGALYALTSMIYCTMPEQEKVVSDMRWSPKTGRLVKNEFSYRECFSSIKIIMIANIIALTMIQLTFKEPLLQFRLLELGVNPNYVGLFFTLDLIGYTSLSLTFSMIPNERRNLNFLVYSGILIASFALFFMGTIHALGMNESTSKLH